MTIRVLALALFFAVRALAQEPDITVDESVDFSQFKTFGIAGGNVDVSEVGLNGKKAGIRIESQIAELLAAKGLRQDVDKPELTIRFELSASNGRAERHEQLSFGNKRRTIMFRVWEARLGVEILDTHTGKIIWRSVARSKETPEGPGIGAAIDEMVRRSVDNYPPNIAAGTNIRFISPVVMLIETTPHRGPSVFANESVDFSTLKTFALREELDSDPLHTRMRSRVEALLAAKGLTKAAQSPDLLVEYSLQVNRGTTEERDGTRIVIFKGTRTHVTAEMRLASSLASVWRTDLTVHTRLTTDPPDPEDLLGLLFDQYPPKK